MRNVWLIFSILFLVGCDRDPPTSDSGIRCEAGHPSADRARLLTQEQLEFLYTEMFRLREANAENHIEYGHYGQPIPENLQFLDAQFVRPNEYDPTVALAKCFDEWVVLSMPGPESENPGVVLRWTAGTLENPYHSESQVLWQLKR